MAKAFPPLVMTLMCDDIRQELFRKVTFVGVYTGNMLLVETLPTRPPQVCFHQKFRNVEGDYKAHFIVLTPSGKELVRTPILDVALKGPEQFVDFNLAFPAIKFEEEGEYKLQTFFDDQRVAEFAFRVAVGPPGT